MPEDLEDFLRRAAERRKQQTRAKLNKSGDAAGPAPQQPRPAPREGDPAESPAAARRREELGRFGDQRDARPAARPETPSRPEPVSRRPEGPRPQEEPRRPRRSDEAPRGPLAPGLPERRQLAQGISQADERMESRLRGTFEHRVGQLDDAADPLATRSPRPGDGLPLDQLAGDPAAAAGALAAAFRDPHFARAAFIASEVFARKF